MSVVLGCIADDFTGATDLAGLLARTGAEVSLRIGLPQKDAPAGSGVEIVALKSRMSPVAEAVADSRAALAWLKRGGAERVYFKYCSTFDSTERGNIGPVALALLEDLGGERTVYCPAFPENGRRVFMGTLFVGRDRLDESPMKDHPLTPMRDANLGRLLAPQLGGAPVGLIDLPTIQAGVEAVRAALGDGPAHLVADTVCDRDLEILAQACRDLPLTTGGSAFGAALLAARGAGAVRADAATLPRVAGGEITLSGSCSAMTRAQVRRYAALVPSLKLDPLRLAAEGAGTAHAWLRAQDPLAPKLIYATAEPAEVEAAQALLGTGAAGALVEEALAGLARAALATGVRRFVVAGGETSGAVAKALGVDRLRIGPEIAPGVPWTFAETPEGPVALALKSGNFGGEDFFAEAHGFFERGGLR